MAESTALQAKYKITKSDVVQTNTLSKGQKITQLEGTGTLKMNKISRLFQVLCKHKKLI